MTKQSDVVGDPSYLPVLDHGFLGLVDHLGDDGAVVQAARVSYGAGTRRVNDDRGLIRYLMRHHHSTPFEMAVVKLHVRAPIFVLRQWQRTRTASINEASYRYSEMTDDCYMPDAGHIQAQSPDNKQGRAGALSPQDSAGVRWMMDAAYDHGRRIYKALLGDRIGNDPARPGSDVIYDPYNEPQVLFGQGFSGIAREIARMVMPVAAYSEMYWQINLHNLLNFLRLRCDPHAQYEIRAYAEAIVSLVRQHYPLCFEAWDDYVRGAVTLSRMEHGLMAACIAAPVPFRDAFAARVAEHGGLKPLAAAHGMSLREIRDFAERFDLAA